MSRAYKAGLADLINDLGGTGFTVAANVEKMSGADLEQAYLTVKNGDTAVLNANGSITHGVNAMFGGNPNHVSLSGADQERFAGDQ